MTTLPPNRRVCRLDLPCLRQAEDAEERRLSPTNGAGPSCTRLPGGLVRPSVGAAGSHPGASGAGEFAPPAGGIAQPTEEPNPCRAPAPRPPGSPRALPKLPPPGAAVEHGVGWHRPGCFLDPGHPATQPGRGVALDPGRVVVRPSRALRWRWCGKGEGAWCERCSGFDRSGPRRCAPWPSRSPTPTTPTGRRCWRRRAPAAKPS